MQLFYLGFALFLDGWLVFDLAIVILSWSFESMQIVRAFRIFRAFRLVTRVKPLRDLVRTSCGAGWKLRNVRGRMRLEVQDHGSVMLIYPWSQEGASSALPRI